MHVLSKGVSYHFSNDPTCTVFHTESLIFAVFPPDTFPWMNSYCWCKNTLWLQACVDRVLCVRHSFSSGGQHTHTKKHTHCCLPALLAPFVSLHRNTTVRQVIHQLSVTACCQEYTLQQKSCVFLKAFERIQIYLKGLPGIFSGPS